MEPPPVNKSWSKNETLSEWIQKHTFGTWKMVDLDNWLVGNPLVIPRHDVKKRSIIWDQEDVLTKERPLEEEDPK